MSTPGNNPKLITVATFGNAIEAHLYKMQLDAEGIECFIADKNAPGIGISEVRLQVWDKDAERALAILQQGAIEDKT